MRLHSRKGKGYFIFGGNYRERERGQRESYGVGRGLTNGKAFMFRIRDGGSTLSDIRGKKCLLTNTVFHHEKPLQKNGQMSMSQ